MGVVEGQRSDSSGLGCECSGIVRKIGRDVINLNVGDRVIVFTTGTLATRVVTKAKVCAKMPDSLSFEDGATMPCVYGTVVHSLLDMGGLEKDMVSTRIQYRYQANTVADRTHTFGKWRCWYCCYSNIPVGGSQGALSPKVYCSYLSF